MADDVTLPATGSKIAADELSTLNGGAVTSVKAQRVKPIYGSDGTGQDVDATHGLPTTPQQPAGATVTQVASATTTTTLKAANTARTGLYVYNDSTATLYLKLGSAASTTSYTLQVPAGGFYEIPGPFYRGIVTGVWSAVNGNAYVTEVA